MRTLVIGDIHAGAKALSQVLKRAGVTHNDRLIFLGDYVDGWSEAVETVEYLMKLQGDHNCIFLRGNHDDLCYHWLDTGEHNPLWLMNGGQATIDSYENAGEQVKKAHLPFYESLRNYHLDNKKRLFLHAGFTNLKGVDFEYFSKTFYWDRTLWELALALDPKIPKDSVSYPKRLLHYSEIYIGHTPLSKIGKSTPYQAANVWNIDTAAAYKGPLTVIDADTKEYWQSDAVHTFYPDENGRN
ncbi:metallophosphoesterase family protein [Muriicola soli]|uniref:Serine/threonine protein phosphatase n=1 Tax=Muriicola soli TaxID=2507538 RepID=A0A411EC89_9FLAO|nr:metallophosphoesterase family protein [Muriicola soli]QBA65238.1 serine/threonine protein phosphatase [Muriicola soli]